MKPQNGGRTMDTKRLKDLKIIRSALRELGYTSKRKEEYEIASFLMAALAVGPNYKKIASLLKINPETSYKLSTRARRAGIFVGDNISAEWGDPKNGSIAFGLDVLVMEGKLKRDEVAA